LYDLVWRYHRGFESVIRPTCHDFPQDPRCLEKNDDMMLGANLLVAAVVESGQAERRVWLPSSGGWVDWRSGQTLQGGRYDTLPAPLDGPPALWAREGCAIPMNFGTLRFGHVEDLRGFQVFPLRGEGGISRSPVSRTAACRRPAATALMANGACGCRARSRACISPSCAKAGGPRFRTAWSCGCPARTCARWASQARCRRRMLPRATGGG
jgi:hypothetical protein